jgi:hypothetical protein
LLPVADGNNCAQPPKAVAAVRIARDATLREVKDIPGLLNATKVSPTIQAKSFDGKQSGRRSD